MSNFTTKFYVFIIYAVEFPIAEFLRVDANAPRAFGLIGQTLCGLEAFRQIFIGCVVHRAIEIAVAQPIVRYTFLRVSAFVVTILALRSLAFSFIRVIVAIEFGITTPAHRNARAVRTSKR